MAVAVMLGARNPQQWLERLALVSAGSVPAVLGWLAIVCVLARTSIAQRPPVMRAVAVGLGAVSGVHDVRSQFRATWRDGVYQVRMEVPA
jgi:two-component system sensor histidine kinase AlgZ